MRAIMLTLLAALVLGACDALPPERAQGPGIAGQPSLELMWTASGFEQPEGAALGPDGSYFISNIGPGDSSLLDGNGYVSKLRPDGSLAQARFAEGLHAPTGMLVIDGILYVADRDGVAMIDAASGAVRGKVAVEGALFLNDVTEWKGDLLVSDSGAGAIYKVTPDGASLFAASAGWAGINGILGDGDRLLIATMEDGKLIEWRGADPETVIAAGMKNADGVGLVPGGGYLVSSWPGEIHYVSADGAVSLLVDTKADGILQNDLSVFGDVVIVPNWEPGTVTAWKIIGQ